MGSKNAYIVLAFHGPVYKKNNKKKRCTKNVIYKL